MEPSAQEIQNAKKSWLQGASAVPKQRQRDHPMYVKHKLAIMYDLELENSKHLHLDFRSTEKGTF